MSEEKREVNLDDNPDEVIAEIDMKNQTVELPEVTEEETEEVTEEVVEPEETPEEEASTDGLKEVEGETPKERAFRATITQLRQDKRDLMSKKTFNKLEESKEEGMDEASYKELIDAGYSKEDIENSTKMLKVIAPMLGLVDKQQTWSERANSMLEDFIEDNQEYKAGNDTDDIRWGHFHEILKNDYNIKGKTPTQLKVIFNKVHRDVVSDLGEAKVVNRKGALEAKKEKIKSVSANTSTSSQKTESKPVEVKKIGDKEHTIGGMKFKGFDDDDF